MSRWSASMLLTTATVGVSARNERSYSSASTTYRRSLPAMQIPFPRAHAAADERRGVAPGRGERDRRHHGRRRLAVRARDGNELSARRHLAQRLGAPNDRHAELARANELRVVFRHRRRHDERARAVDVRRDRAASRPRRGEEGPAPTTDWRRSP